MPDHEKPSGKNPEVPDDSLSFTESRPTVRVAAEAGKQSIIRESITARAVPGQRSAAEADPDARRKFGRIDARVENETHKITAQVEAIAAAERIFIDPSSEIKLADGQAVQFDTAHLRAPSITKDPQTDQVEYTITQAYKKDKILGNAIFKMCVTDDGKFRYRYKLSNHDKKFTVWKEANNARQMHEEIADYYSVIDRLVKSVELNAVRTTFIEGLDPDRLILSTGRLLDLNFNRVDHFLDVGATTEDANSVHLTYSHAKFDSAHHLGERYSHAPAKFDVIFNTDGTAMVRYQTGDGVTPVEQPIAANTPAAIEAAFGQFTQAVEQYCLTQERQLEEREQMEAVRQRYIVSANPNRNEVSLANRLALQSIFPEYLAAGNLTVNTTNPTGPFEYTWVQPYQNDLQGNPLGKGSATFSLHLERDEQVVRYKTADNQPEQRVVVRAPDDVINAHALYVSTIYTTQEQARISRANLPGAQELSQRVRVDASRRQPDNDQFLSRQAIEAAFEEPNSEMGRQLQALVAELASKPADNTTPIDFLRLPATAELARLLGVSADSIRDVFLAQDAHLYEEAKLKYKGGQTSITAQDSFLTKLKKGAKEVGAKVGLNLAKIGGGTVVGAGAMYAGGAFAGITFGLAAPVAAGAIGGAALVRVVDGLIQSYNDNKGIAAKEAELRGGLANNPELMRQLSGGLAEAKRAELAGRFDPAAETAVNDARLEYVAGSMLQATYEAEVIARADQVQGNALNNVLAQLNIDPVDYQRVQDDHRDLPGIITVQEDAVRAAGGDPNTDRAVLNLRAGQQQVEQQWRAYAPIEQLANGARDAYLLDEVNNLYAAQRPRLGNNLIDRTMARTDRIKNNRLFSYTTLGQGKGRWFDKIAQAGVFTGIAFAIREAPLLRLYTTGVGSARFGAWVGEKGGEALAKLYYREQGKEYASEITADSVRALPVNADPRTIDRLLGRLTNQLNNPAFERKHTTNGQLSAEYRNLQTSLRELQSRLIGQTRVDVRQFTAMNNRFQETRTHQRNFDYVKFGAKMAGGMVGGALGIALGIKLNEWFPISQTPAETKVSSVEPSSGSDGSRFNPLASNTVEAAEVHRTVSADFDPKKIMENQRRVQLNMAEGKLPGALRLEDVDQGGDGTPVPSAARGYVPDAAGHNTVEPVRAAAPVEVAPPVETPATPTVPTVEYDAVVHKGGEGFSNPLKRWLEAKADSGHVSATELRAKVDDTYITLDGKKVSIHDIDHNQQLWAMQGDTMEARFTDQPDGSIEMKLYSTTDHHQLTAEELRSGMIKEHTIVSARSSATSHNIEVKPSQLPVNHLEPTFRGIKVPPVDYSEAVQQSVDSLRNASKDSFERSDFSGKIFPGEANTSDHDVSQSASVTAEHSSSAPVAAPAKGAPVIENVAVSGTLERTLHLHRADFDVVKHDLLAKLQDTTSGNKVVVNGLEFHRTIADSVEVKLAGSTDMPVEYTAKIHEQLRSYLVFTEHKVDATEWTKAVHDATAVPVAEVVQPGLPKTMAAFETVLKKDADHSVEMNGVKFDYVDDAQKHGVFAYIPSKHVAHNGALILPAREVTPEVYNKLLQTPAARWQDLLDPTKQNQQAVR